MRMRSLICGVLSSCLVWSTFPAKAEMISSDRLLSAATEAAHQDRVEAFLDRADVQEQLEALGVDRAEAAERVASLTESELRLLSENIDELPAGAGVAELVVIVLLVLIVLELLGAINIFSKI